MADTAHSPLYRRLTRLRIQAPLLALALVLAHQIFEHTLIADLPRWQHFLTQVLFYGLVGPLLAWLALSSLRRSVGATVEAEREVQRAQRELTTANEHLRLLIEVNHRLGEAEDEQMLLESALQLPGEVLRAVGSTLIRFGDDRQPLPALHAGELDPADFKTWADHLSSAAIRETCACCNPTATASCPQLSAQPGSPVGSVICVPLEHGRRSLGLLVVYLDGETTPTNDERELLTTLAGEIALALESHRLRSRELETIYRLQQIRRLSDLHTELAAILAATVDALEVTGGVLLLREPAHSNLHLVAESGRQLGDSLGAVRGLIEGVETPVVIRDFELESQPGGPRSLLFAPLHGPDAAPQGALVLWADAPDAFNRRHLRLAEMIAGQQALLVENYKLYGQVEHKAALDERARLAREIHDGLAQVLGYLKLRTHQLLNWSRSGTSERVSAGLNEMAELISSAYADAREAIDNLRISPEGSDLAQLQAQVVSEFADGSQIDVTAAPPPEGPFTPEVASQVLRILQEGLGNVRRHARASHAEISWQRSGPWATLRIADDGRGFAPEEVPPLSRHGLRTMRERCELLGGEFQIRSRPGQGTELTFRIPMPRLELLDG